MENLTAGDIWRRYEELERAGGDLLGKLSLQFGRLEYALGLAVRNVEAGRYLGGSGFHARLDSFRKVVNERHRQTKFLREPYDRWMDRADRMRQIRNDLVHGRWVPEPREYCLLNVVTSADMVEQRSKPYSLSELEILANEVQKLNVELGKLLRRQEF